MEVIFNKICVLVTAAFALTLVPGFRRPGRSLISMRDRWTALLVFLLLGLVEEASVRQTGWFNHRIVVVCTASLLAGPGVGVIVGLFLTWSAVTCDGRPMVTIALEMASASLIGGFIHRWRHKMAQRPLTGFCVTVGVSLLRDGPNFFYVPSAPAILQTLGQLGLAAALQGSGTAMILAIVEQVRERDEQTRAKASAEVRALQARMNPHFLFNALNAVAALAMVEPRKIPCAVGRLHQFLRTSFEPHDRALVPLEEELTVVRAYLDIEALRFGTRLKVEQTIGTGLAAALTPPFSLQPLVENAVRHGLESSPKAGRLRLTVRLAGQWVEMSVSDDGQGVPSTEIEQIFFAPRPSMNALVLLRRRLQGLFGHRFRLEVWSEIGRGTTVTLRIPLRTRLEVEGKSLEAKSHQKIADRSIDLNAVSTKERPLRKKWRIF
jgi:two-component system, LytTR family, sensor kinase